MNLGVELEATQSVSPLIAQNLNKTSYRDVFLSVSEFLMAGLYIYPYIWTSQKDTASPV